MTPPDRSAPVVAVTGASGFIGGGVARHLLADEGRLSGVVALGRRPGPAGTDHRSFDLGRRPETGVLAGVDVLVHAAYDFAPTASEEIYRRNVVGTELLLRAARRDGVRRVVLISSMSAYPGSRQIYGRAKLESERLVAELGGVALRLGLVWGEGAGGMAAAVARLSRLPVVPVLGRRSHQFLVHRADVDQAIAIAVRDPSLRGVVGLAHEARVPVPTLLTGLAAPEPAGRLVPVPWRPVYLAMRAAEASRLPLPLRADSVLGLTCPAPSVPRAAEWRERGLILRPFRPAERPTG